MSTAHKNFAFCLVTTGDVVTNPRFTYEGWPVLAVTNTLKKRVTAGDKRPPCPCLSPTVTTLAGRLVTAKKRGFHRRKRRLSPRHHCHHAKTQLLDEVAS
jgi:hypothetical protein